MLQARQTLETLAIVGGAAAQIGKGKNGGATTAEELANSIEASLAADEDTDPALDDRLARSLDEPLLHFGRAVTGSGGFPDNAVAWSSIPGAFRSRRAFLLRRFSIIRGPKTCRRWALPGLIRRPNRRRP